MHFWSGTGWRDTCCCILRVADMHIYPPCIYYVLHILNHVYRWLVPRTLTSLSLNKLIADYYGVWHKLRDKCLTHLYLDWAMTIFCIIMDLGFKVITFLSSDNLHV